MFIAMSSPFLREVKLTQTWRPGGKMLCRYSITSHHVVKTEAGLKGLYIREITLKYKYITHRIATL